MARHGFHLSVGFANPEQLCGMGFGAALQRPWCPRDGSQSRAMRRSAQGSPQAASMQAVRTGVHAGASYRRTHGFFGRIMRSLLQLRTPQNGNGEHPEPDRVTAEMALDEFPPVRFREPQIEMAHGAGGKASRRLVEGLFAPLFFGKSPASLGDAAHLEINGAQVAITTDSFVVKPLSFPGGSIGELAVNGTVNDLAVSGAKAEALVCTYVLEAGLRTEVLEAEVRAMATAARKAGVKIVGGDTKVVEHGKADG